MLTGSSLSYEITSDFSSLLKKKKNLHLKKWFMGIPQQFNG